MMYSQCGFLLCISIVCYTATCGFVPTANGARRTRVSRRLLALIEENEMNESKRLTKARELLRQVTEEAPEQVGSFTTTEVPENVWSNGLLDGSDVVTRYAFRKGVKIAEPLVKYSPETAEKALLNQPNRWIVRNIQIAFPIGLWAVSVVSDFVLGKTDRRRERAQQLQRAISKLGPALIKGGQALASRPDLLPKEYLEEMQLLQDKVPPFDCQKAFQIVEEELGAKFEDVFELVQEEPVAAASIGQVYKAKLRTTGQEIALKIQRPNCEDIIALDLYILRWWSGIYNQIFKLLKRDIDVQSIIDDFGELIYREIDYVAEAANAQRFNELYASIPDVFVPKVYSDLTTRKVLVMEWVDGVRLTDSASLATYGLETSKLVDTLVQCSLQQILENGFFHADPHAGNLLACADGRLCYLDFGMMSYADRRQRNGFLLAVVHIVNRDWSALVQVYQKLGFIPEDIDVKPIEVALDKALPDVLNSQISDVNFSRIVNRLGDIMYKFPFSLPPFYIAIIRCLGVLEGLAIQVDPTSRIISEAYPYVASRVLTDPQDDLQEALRRLALTSDGKIRWNRLEGLFQEARGTSRFDVVMSFDVLTDYVLSDDGDLLLQDLSEQIVTAADSLGVEGISYLLKFTRAFAISDEVAAIRASRSLRLLLDGNFQDDAKKLFPEPTPAMQRFSHLLSLLDLSGDTDSAKFIPIFRKLAQEPKIQRVAGEVVAKLGERALSRSLRVVFGLPPPKFDGDSNSASTVFEESMAR
mmetsp:Transcript_35020/g.84763  ORF Transcript_35020/g.84763 Transcript_35020/m.84763 type:complete len:756 (-) Transcript_35020:3488-5755(-)